MGLGRVEALCEAWSVGIYTRILDDLEASIYKTHPLIYKIRRVIPLAGAFRGAAVLTRILDQTESFMAKALRGEAAVLLPRTSNNAGHGSLRLARRVKIIMLVGR